MQKGEVARKSGLYALGKKAAWRVKKSFGHLYGLAQAKRQKVYNCSAWWHYRYFSKPRFRREGIAFIIACLPVGVLFVG